MNCKANIIYMLSEKKKFNLNIFAGKLVCYRSGGGCLPQCMWGSIPMGLGLDPPGCGPGHRPWPDPHPHPTSPPGVDLETPPTRPPTSSWVWVWKPTLARPPTPPIVDLETPLARPPAFPLCLGLDTSPLVNRMTDRQV